MALHYSGDGGYFYVNKSETSKFKAQDNIPWYEFHLGSASKDFTKDEMGEILLNSTAFDFSIDPSAMGKEDIFNIHEHLMKKNNI